MPKRLLFDPVTRKPAFLPRDAATALLLGTIIGAWLALILAVLP